MAAMVRGREGGQHDHVGDGHGYGGRSQRGRGGCSTTMEAPDIGFFPRHDMSTIIDGCNDLLLYYASRPTAFHVVNPTTRRWAKLPPPCARMLISILAFDPYASSYYRVVCFTG